MASDHMTGALLRLLVSSKPNGNILELGTGTGLSTCWILDGMNSGSRLTTVDNDSLFVNIVKKLINTLENNENYHITKLCWSTGIILVTRI